MFDLPVDVIRYIIKVSIEKEPLSLFDFDEEIFKKGEYTKDEIKELILKFMKIIKQGKKFIKMFRKL